MANFDAFQVVFSEALSFTKIFVCAVIFGVIFYDRYKKLDIDISQLLKQQK